MLVNRGCWTVYGFSYHDINIIVANSSGVVLETIAFIMWCYLRKKYRELHKINDVLECANVDIISLGKVYI